jgi:hypothetical protein
VSREVVGAVVGVGGPKDLGDDAAYGVGLLKVGEGLLGMAHLGAHLAEEAGDLVLCALGGTDVLAVGADSCRERGIAEGIEGVFHPLEEGLVLTKEAALIGGIGTCLELWLNRGRA